MFGRIMAVVVAVIVLLTSVLSGLGLYTLTSRQTAIRQENLRAEARVKHLRRAQKEALLAGADVLEFD